jgi:segregation and condensation protein B
MEKEEKKRIVEALLFSIDEPLTIKRIKSVIKEITKTEIDEIVAELNVIYANHSFEIRFVAEGYRMFVKPEYSSWVSDLWQTNRSSRLTPQALETLAIVAYKQPVTRAGINDIRGVDSTGTLQGLLEKKLITISGRAELPGRPMLYATTDFFLETFGLGSLKDLPKIRELEQILKNEEGDHQVRLKLGTYLFEKKEQEESNNEN